MGIPVEIKYKIEWFTQIQLSGDICDYCGETLDEFPCATVMNEDGENPHALCMNCRVKSEISPDDNEYFETLAFQAEEEPPMPGKNYGGRKIS